MATADRADNLEAMEPEWESLSSYSSEPHSQEEEFLSGSFESDSPPDWSE